VLRFLLLGWLLGLVDALGGPGLVPIGGLPLIVQWVILFLTLDLARWALHLAHHRIPWLWRFHRVHHSSERLNATSGMRMHVVDFLQLALLPVLLFGVLFQLGETPVWLAPSVLVPGLVSDAFQHANVRIPIRSRFWRAWDAVLNNPHFHAWHHTNEGRLCDGNYGNVLTIWDRLFRTCVSREALPEGFGLERGDRLVNGAVSLQLLRGSAE
jgi:sterol desaturase/sphingolipid hydroxylase (fatty acid hydroxylase superfamily)